MMRGQDASLSERMLYIPWASKTMKIWQVLQDACSQKLSMLAMYND